MKIIMGMLAIGVLVGGPATAIGGEINTLLEVDITDQNRVKISAVENASPVVSSSGSLVYDGIFLEGFFTTYALFQGPASGDLSPNGSSRPYNHAESPESENYLNIYRGGIGLQSFEPSLPAFDGALMLDLGGQFTAEPGTIGDISLRNSTNDGSALVIGQWAIIDSSGAVAESERASTVSEPGSVALLALGLAAIACRRQH